jgi:hypothetical protein
MGKRARHHYAVLELRSPCSCETAQKTWKEMLFYTEQLKRGHLELERLHAEVRHELDRYLNTNT